MWSQMNSGKLVMWPEMDGGNEVLLTLFGLTLAWMSCHDNDFVPWCQRDWARERLLKALSKKKNAFCHTDLDIFVNSKGMGFEQLGVYFVSKTCFWGVFATSVTTTPHVAFVTFSPLQPYCLCNLFTAPPSVALVTCSVSVCFRPRQSTKKQRGLAQFANTGSWSHACWGRTKMTLTSRCTQCRQTAHQRTLVLTRAGAKSSPWSWCWPAMTRRGRTWRAPSTTHLKSWSCSSRASTESAPSSNARMHPMCPLCQLWRMCIMWVSYSFVLALLACMWLGGGEGIMGCEVLL